MHAGTTSKPIRIGGGASFADDRIHPAVELVKKGRLDYIAFECLAERTIARENQTRKKDPSKGYTPRLMQRMSAVLADCVRNNVKIVSSMGAANPLGACREVLRYAKEQALAVRCAAVLGDDVTELVRRNPELVMLEDGKAVETILPRMVSANAYLGANVIADALGTGANVVLTGRVGDPSLFLAAAMHHYGWSYDDLERLANGIAMGHLMECSSQVTGGNFADCGRKVVPDLVNLGFPIAEIDRDGNCTITKLEDAGGLVDVSTCTEQLLYELHDPENYVTPDCVLDVSGLDFEQVGKDAVRFRGAAAKPRTPFYKVTVGYDDGYIGEGQISYAGINAVEKAKVAAHLIEERLKRHSGHSYSEWRVDLIGIDSLHKNTQDRIEPYEVRLRVAGRTDNKQAAEAIGFETRALHVQGPAGGAGASDPIVKEVLAVKSVLLPRELVDPQVCVQVVE
jgi:hypothetical protein